MVESRGVQNSALMFDSMRVRVRVFFKAVRELLLGPGPVFFFGVYVFRCAFSLSSSSSSSSSVSISFSRDQSSFPDL